MSGSLNPNIIMGFRPTPNIGPDVGQMTANANALLQLNQQQQQAQRLDQLRKILGQPDAIDATGQPTPDALKQVTAIDPNLGIKLRQNSLSMQENTIRRDAMKTDLFANKMKTMGSAYAPIMETYEQNVKDGMPPPQAAAAAQQSLSEANEEMSNGGFLSEDEQKRLPTKFDPIHMRNVVAGTQQYEKWRQDQRQDKKEAEAGWQVVADPGKLGPDGKPIQYRYNPGTGQATTLDLQPYKPTGVMKPDQAKTEFGNPVTVEWTEDGKKVRKTLEQDKANGGWVDAATRKSVPVGSDMRIVPPGEITKTTGGLDDETADRLALQMAKGQPVSAVMSIRNQADIDKLQNKLTQVYKDQGKSPEEAAELATRAAARWHSVTRTYDQFTSAQQGSPGGQVVAANTAIQHIAVAREAAKALQNGDINLVNRIWQKIAEETGDPAPTNMNAISQFVANEVSRASAGAALTGEERSAMRSDIENYRSPQQLNGVLDKFQQLLVGKLNSLRYNYRFGTGIKDPDDPYSFETLVGSPETLKILGWDKKGQPGPSDAQSRVGQKPTADELKSLPKLTSPSDVARLKLAPGTPVILPDGTIGAVPGGSTSAPQAGPRVNQPSAPVDESQVGEKAYALPKEYAGDPEGKRYKDKDGNVFVRRGNTLVQMPKQQDAATQKELDRARVAISQGAPRDKVEKMLRDAGIDPGGL